MNLDVLIKEILRDLEKIKESDTTSEIIDEITLFSLTILSTISMTSKTINEFDIAPVLTSVVDDPPAAQNTGSFLVGTARVGFSDAA